MVICNSFCFDHISSDCSSKRSVGRMFTSWCSVELV